MEVPTWVCFVYTIITCYWNFYENLNAELEFRPMQSKHDTYTNVKKVFREPSYISQFTDIQENWKIITLESNNVKSGKAFPY
jgi:hypothetical protein